MEANRKSKNVIPVKLAKIYKNNVSTEFPLNIFFVSENIASESLGNILAFRRIKFNLIFYGKRRKICSHIMVMYSSIRAICYLYLSKWKRSSSFM